MLGFAIPVILLAGYLYGRRVEVPCSGSNVKFESSRDNLHTHSLCVPQLTPGALVGLSASPLVTSKDFGHTHQVQLSAGQMGILLAGTPVTVRSSTDFDHSHSITLGR